MPETPDKLYKRLESEAQALLQDPWFTNLSNLSALLFANLERLNWVGFYLAHENELFLGPFQGQVACVRIPFSKGVCGAAARSRKIQIVPDVHLFPDHIVCDVKSRSEIVIPLMQGDRLLGVLDVDSPNVGRFSEVDAQGLRRLIDILVSATPWPKSFL